MLLKSSQQKVVSKIDTFFEGWKQEELTYEQTRIQLRSNGLENLLENLKQPLIELFGKNPDYTAFTDRPAIQGKFYPRVCLQVPTGGGKTLLGIETILSFHEKYAERRTGLIVWIVHSEAIYKQTIEKLRDKTSAYRQKLDQLSGNRTTVVEKTDVIRFRDTQESLVVLMLMIQSANRESRENLKIFKDSGTFLDFFPSENERERVEGLLADYPTLEFLEHPITATKSIKTSLGNIIRVCKPLFVIDEFHKIFTEAQRAVIDSLNPRCIVGLSATPKNEMNILARVSGMDLYRDEMIKLPINVRPEANDNWRELIHDVQRKRDELESIAVKHKEQKGDYIRPIALLQAERTGRETRDNTHVHADDIREYLLQIGIPAEWIAIKSAYVDELKDEVLMSRDCQIRYIITKQALMEGWDCPFAYVLGVIPRSRQVTALTQLVGRVLRQPYTKRTGVAALDQCYTFFNYADGEELLQGIKQALEADGLEDVVDSVIGTSGPSGQHLEYRAFPIQKSIQEKYGASLFLPLWHIKDGKKIRLLSYRTDITSRINWSDLDSTDLAKSLIDTVGRRKIKGRDLQYFLGDHYQGRGSDYEKEHIEGGDEYVISQIISEHVSNPFVAFEIVKQIIAAVQKQLPRSDIEEDFGYIAHEIAKFIRTESEKREEEVFNALVEGNTVFLAISDEGGYKIPETYYAPAKYDEIEEKYIPVKSNPQCLHLAVDYITMNNLEKEIVEELKQQEGVLWWMRNKVDPSFYKIQAWRKNKIYPDFVIAKQNSEKKLELIYILESKGDQLAENLDTKYKELVFQKMTEVVSKNHLVSKQFSQYDFKLIPQSEVRSAIRGFFS